MDGDGIRYRTLPGTDHPSAAWFARGSGHNEKSQYSERPDDYANNMDRLARKFETARTLVPEPEIVRNDGNEVGIIAYGTSHHARGRDARPAANEYGVHADYLRLRAYPFTQRNPRFHRQRTSGFTSSIRTATAQMHELLKLDIAVEDIAKLRSVRHYNGLPIDARSITDDIISQEGK